MMIALGGNRRNTLAWRLRQLLSVLLTAIMLGNVGCSRNFWRRQADQDSYQQLNLKDTDPRWVNPRKQLTPDPRSRFYDPYDPDQAPLPPDDPAAAQIMEDPGGLPGYKSWHELGRSFTVENPGWLSQFEISPDSLDPKTGEYTEPIPMIADLDILDAIELTYLHNRDYQFQLEQAYLAALALTLERFRFQVRYLGVGGGEPGGSLTYANVPGFQDSLNMNNRFGVSQLLPTGGQWAVELANNTLWIFSGPNAGTNSASLLSYRLVQPLLLGAGRKIALESLTQTERELLYTVRDLARFRKELFTQTVSGGAGGGYLGLLTQLQGIRNQRYNIRQLERQVRELRANAVVPPGNTESPLEQLPPGLMLEELFDGKLRYLENEQVLVWSGPMSAEQAEQLLGLSDAPEWRAAAREFVQLLRSDITPLDVAQLESRLASSIISLRNSERRFQDALDGYKIQLGLPPNVVVTVDESGLEQFELIDPILEQLQEETDDFIEKTGLLVSEPGGVANYEQSRQILSEIEPLYDRIMDSGVTLVERDVERVDANLAERLEGVEDPAERDELLTSIRRDQSQLLALKDEFEALGRRIVRIRQLVEQGKTDPDSLLAANRSIQLLREELLLKVQGLQVVQVSLRSELIDINRYTFGLEDSVGLALENRLDLMNARADVVDARRLQEVAANELKAVLDVIVEGDIRNEPGSSTPFNFSGTSSSHRVGVQFTAPLDQVAERNAYRATQINYQRARRDYMQFEDQVKLSVRASWRNLQILEQNLETARQALRINVIQYDQAVEESNDPERSNQGGVRGRNLVDALNSILNAQNDLVQIWAEYERERLNIHRDMGMMEIDAQGVWVDNYYQGLIQTALLTPPEPAPLPPEPTAGDFDVLLLPPGPAGNEYGHDDSSTDNIAESSAGIAKSVERIRLPDAPAANTAQQDTFVGDPLGWRPGTAPRRLFHDEPALRQQQPDGLGQSGSGTGPDFPQRQ